ncbi:zinc finger MYND domain-containing protein 15 [Varanus komodoensis]|uniref:zinc finger MYND domain-containing protein 15 n=1 Tax=Varanus komodoensis TaxID=61221 RepID=UPI001CF7BEF8|nr:zinc finger MYND domain-containing protein 15 [Varanus komodoensis]
MEFLTGYRAEILDFAELLFGWYQRFLVDAACQRGGKSLEGCIRRLPPDPALWVLHLLPNHSLAFAVADPGQQLGGRFYSEDALALRDLDRFITFTDTEEEEEQQQQQAGEDPASLERGGGSRGAGCGDACSAGEWGEVGRGGVAATRVPLVSLGPAAAEQEPCQGGPQKPGAGASAAPRDPRQASPTSGAPAAGRAGERRLLWGPAGAGVGRLTGGQRLTPSLPAGHPLWRVDRLLLVTDEHGSIMGFDFLLGGPLGVAGQEPLEARAIALLCQSMTCPLGAGEPRRPKQLTVGDPALQKSLEPLLSRLGVKLSEGPLRGWGPRPAFTFPSTRVPACHVCKRHSFEAHVAACQHCRAVLYCSERCRTLDWNRSPEDVGHRFWCQRMAGYMSRAPELADLPFTFAAEATSETFNKEGFLSARGLTRGYWAGESMLVPGPHGSPGSPWRTHSCPGPQRNPFEALRPEGGVALQAAPPEPPTARTFFGSWKEYYQWRGLSLSAPPAVILTYPLTLYYIITQLAPQDFPELNILNKQSLKIHVVETGKEFGVLMVFWELSVLLPHVSLELLLVGDLVPPELDGQQFLLQRDVHGVSVQPGLAPRSKGGRRELQLGFSARPYHLLQAPKADLVIAFNSGLALKETWRSSLPRLQSLRVPAYFTECSEYSCAVDEAAVSMATGGSASAPQINPFRSPFRQAGIDNAMPWYSNAFIFHLIYKASAGGHRQAAAPAAQPLPASGTPEPPEAARSRRKEKKQTRAAGRRRK